MPACIHTYIDTYIQMYIYVQLVHEEYLHWLHWALKYIGMAYFGLFDSPGFEFSHSGSGPDVHTSLSELALIDDPKWIRLCRDPYCHLKRKDGASEPKDGDNEP